MIYSKSLSLQIPDSGACAALGNFDGLHIGHRAVIENAAGSGYYSVVVTFARSPRAYIDTPPPTLLTHSLKLRELESMGVDAVVDLDFAEVRHLTPTEFIELLQSKLKLCRIVCGFNYHFGQNGAGDAALLEQLASRFGIESVITPPVTLSGEEVSSTAIRRLLRSGDLEKANQMLGRPFSYDFSVVHGASRGHSFGYPTINQPFPAGFVLPAFGVYATRTVIDGKLYPSVTNIGIRPTYLAHTPLSETYIHGFSGDLYDRNVEVRLIRFMRGEVAFESAGELIRQLRADSEESLRILGEPV